MTFEGTSSAVLRGRDGVGNGGSGVSIPRLPALPSERLLPDELRPPRLLLRRRPPVPGGHANLRQVPFGPLQIHSKFALTLQHTQGVAALRRLRHQLPRRRRHPAPELSQQTRPPALPATQLTPNVYIVFLFFLFSEAVPVERFVFASFAFFMICLQICHLKLEDSMKCY